MDFIVERASQINTLLTTWNNLTERQQKTQSINFIIAIVHSASVLNFVIDHSDDQKLQDYSMKLKEELSKFKTNFFELFTVDLDLHGRYDLSTEVKSVAQSIFERSEEHTSELQSH